MRPKSRILEHFHKPIETPRKPLADSTHRKVKRIGSQNYGKPDYFKNVNIEEFRTQPNAKYLLTLQEGDCDNEDVQKVIKTLAENLKTPGTVDDDNIHVGNFRVTNANLELVNQKVRERLILAAEKAGMDAVILPEETAAQATEILQNIDHQVSFGQKHGVTVIPTIDIRGLLPTDIVVLTDSFENGFDCELPIIGIRRFNPFYHAARFFSFREQTDKFLYLVSSEKRVTGEVANGRFSEEEIMANMGVDLIGQYFHLGGYSNEDEKKGTNEIKIDLYNPDTRVYNKVNLTEADSLDTEKFYIFNELDPAGIIDRFCPEGKAQKAARLHNEIAVGKRIEELRHHLQEGTYDDYRKETALLGDALEEVGV